MVKFVSNWIWVPIFFMLSGAYGMTKFSPAKIILTLEFGHCQSGSWSVLCLLDWMAVTFLGSIMLISTAVFIFSSSYMQGAPRNKGFHILVILFIASMLLLILSPSLFSGLLGWDGLGMTSYLLVIFYGSAKAFNSGLITALSNRVGDILLISSLALVYQAGTFDLFFLSNQGFSAWSYFFLIILAATTKSAQVPFSAWLPAAMAAPTPVSALVHSSTLVTAGVYLTIRHTAISAISAQYLMYASLATSWVASLIALSELDLKKIVALSTLSQLGLMMTMVATGLKEVAFFHLLAHAFFKALTFISAGSVIHSNSGYQDTRWVSTFTGFYSGLFSLVLGSLSLAGIPFMSAFFTKELLIEIFLTQSQSMALSSLLLGSVALTAAYSSRLLKKLFFSPAGAEALSFRRDTDAFSFFAMAMLAPLAMGGGYILATAMSMLLMTATSSTTFKALILFLVTFGAILGLSGLPAPAPVFYMWGMAPMFTQSASLFSKLTLPLLTSADRGLTSLFTKEVLNITANLQTSLFRPRTFSLMSLTYPLMVFSLMAYWL